MRQHEQQRLLNARINFFEYVIIVAFAVLVFGFWHHQVVQSPHFAELAERNRVRHIPLMAPRGRIYDRERRILVDSRPSYNAVLIRENSPRPVEETIAIISRGLKVPDQDLLDRVNRRRKEPKFRPIVLKEDLSIPEIAFLKAHRYELPEISVEFQPRRRYVGREIAAHVLGYVGEVTEQELASPEFMDLKPGDIVGQYGLERQYDAGLRGKDGFKRVIVNNSGREMGRLYEEAPISGNDLVTTIDLDLQGAAEEAIGGRMGGAVAIDPQTGEVLALVSKPSFDPNLFATRISRAEWTDLISDPGTPLQNRVIQSRFSPGSVFKIFMAAAALETEVVNPLRTIFCGGAATFYGHTFVCWKRGGHGTVAIHHAIVQSCNVFFYNLGKDIGIDRIAAFATRTGLGRKTGIDLPNEDAGLIPSSEWKQRVHKTAWFAGETISVSIGQGPVSVTPVQLAWAVGGVAMGGQLKQLHLVQPEEAKKHGFNVPELRNEEFTIRQSTVQLIGRALWGVVNEWGTGARARIGGFDVAGKTGTTQVVGREADAKGSQFDDHAWFVGFAPYRNPQIVVAVFIENGGRGGQSAAPVARAILQVYYDKKTGRFKEGSSEVRLDDE